MMEQLQFLIFKEYYDQEGKQVNDPSICTIIKDTDRLKTKDVKDWFINTLFAES